MRFSGHYYFIVQLNKIHRTIRIKIVLNITLIFQIILLTGFQTNENNLKSQNPDIRSIYLESGLGKILSFDVFELSVRGMQNIREIKNRKVITIVDFSKQSSQERFVVIDLVNKKILYKTLVAHGRNSGENNADSFSNTPESQKSCLGFFMTAETYYGKHGYSLSLDGLEPGINDNARMRSIVIHGADYVSQSFIDRYGRLGRSWGCPALPTGVSKEIIDKISGGSCLFIYGNDQEYIKSSKIINRN
jgi:hypothetical protein